MESSVDQRSLKNASVLPSHIPMPVSKSSLEKLFPSPPVALTSLSRWWLPTSPKTRSSVLTPLDAPLPPVDTPSGTSSPPPGGLSPSSDKRDSSRTSLTKDSHTSAHALRMSTVSPRCSEVTKRPPPCSAPALRPVPTCHDHDARCTYCNGPQFTITWMLELTYMNQANPIRYELTILYYTATTNITTYKLYFQE